MELHTTRPIISTLEATQVMKTFYNREITTITELKSHEARNFLVVTSTNESFVLKFIQEENSDSLDLQFECMRHLQKHGFVTPQPVETVNGEVYFNYVGNKSKCTVYLLTYIPGEVAQTAIKSQDVLFNIGLFIVETQKTLKGFKPKAPSPGDMNWNIEKIPELTEFLPELKTDHERELIGKAVHIFKDNMDRLKSLEKGWIHGDLHDENLIILDSKQSEDKAHVDLKPAKCSEDEMCSDSKPSKNVNGVKQWFGIIDFEDLHENYGIMDVLIAMAVFMMSVQPDDGKFLEVSSHILAGYTSKAAITSAEKDVMYSVILGRYAQELVLCSVQNNHQSEPNAYLTEIFQNAWPQLEFLLQCGEDYVWKVWNDVLKPRE